MNSCVNKRFTSHIHVYYLYQSISYSIHSWKIRGIRCSFRRVFGKWASFSREKCGKIIKNSFSVSRWKCSAVNLELCIGRLYDCFGPAIRCCKHKYFVQLFILPATTITTIYALVRSQFNFSTKLTKPNMAVKFCRNTVFSTFGRG